jgi:hypothetical protein
MTEYETTSLDLLRQIRDAITARPAPAACGSSQRAAPPSDGTWQTFPWPAFTNKSGKRRAVTLGESAADGEYGQKDLRWWGENYAPKPYKGSISKADTDFRAALDAAVDALDGAPTSHTSGQPAPSRPAHQPAKPPAGGGGGGGTEDVPFNSIRDFAQ